MDPHVWKARESSVQSTDIPEAPFKSDKTICREVWSKEKYVTA